jgi:rhodanese-related sulfurtransferase
VWIVDGRDREAFASSHVPGSLNIEVNELFASYVGWLIPFGDPLVLVLPSPDALGNAVTQLHRVGYEDLRGFLDGGIGAWTAEGRPVGAYPLADVDALCEALRGEASITVLDVRQDLERARARLPGSLEVFVGDLPARLHEVPHDREAWAICASGHRSAIAASLLDRERIPVRLVTPGGVREVLGACGD